MINTIINTYVVNVLMRKGVQFTKNRFYLHSNNSTHKQVK